MKKITGIIILFVCISFNTICNDKGERDRGADVLGIIGGSILSYSVMAYSQHSFGESDSIYYTYFKEKIDDNQMILAGDIFTKKELKKHNLKSSDSIDLFETELGIVLSNKDNLILVIGKEEQNFFIHEKRSY